MRRSGLTRTSVFTQKLPDSYKSTDISDDKGIVTLPPSFNIMKRGKPFSLERPRFEKGTSRAIVDESKRDFDIAKLNKRSGLGNNTLLRDNFRTPDVLARQAVDFALQELLDRQQQGIKVQLGDKTLRDLFQVKTVDPSDFAWIAEYNRRISAGETKEQLAISPPFGREQRVMFKTVNFGSATSLSEASALSITEQLTFIRDTITGGSSSSDLPNIMAKVLELTTKLDAFSNDNIIMLAEILAKSKVISTDPKEFFASIVPYHRFWDAGQVQANFPMISTFLTNGAKDPLTPVTGLKKVVMSLKTMQIELAKGVRGVVWDSSGKEAPKPPYIGYVTYLDIETKSLVTRDQVIEAVSTGIDDFRIGGLTAPPILVEGMGLTPVTGKWMPMSEEDKLSAASTAGKASSSKEPMPPPEPKAPKPSGSEPSGSEPRDPSVKRDKGKTTKEARERIIALRAKRITSATLPVLEPNVDVYSEENPDILHRSYAVSDARTKEMANNGDIYKVGKKWYRKDA